VIFAVFAKVTIAKFVTAAKENFMTIPMANLEQGQLAIIDSFVESGPFARRARDIGLIPGMEIIFRKAAPLGDPMEIRLRNHSVMIRKDDAKKIMVRMA